MRVARRLSRLVALLVSVVFASASLTMSGYGCVSPMSSASMHHAANATQASHRGNACEPAPGEMPCHSPMSHAPCAGMASCASVALPSTARVVARSASTSQRVDDRSQRLAAGVASAPDLPPPRA